MFALEPPVVGTVANTRTASNDLEIAFSVFGEFIVHEFAVRLIKEPLNKNQHASTLCCGDAQRTLQLIGLTNCNDFVHYVDKVRKGLTSSDMESTKEDFISELQSLIASTNNDKIKLEALRLKAEVCGHLKKDPVIQNNNTIQAVMVVPATTSGADWEAKAATYQHNLIEGAKQLEQ